MIDRIKRSDRETVREAAHTLERLFVGPVSVRATNGLISRARHITSGTQTGIAASRLITVED